MRARWVVLALALGGCTELLPGDVVCCGDDAGADAGRRDAGDPDVDAGPGRDGGDAGDLDAGDLDGATDAGDGVDGGTQTVAVLVAAGGRHSCAYLADDRIVCWGSNQRGQINGTASSGPLGVTTVMARSQIRFLCAGGNFTCAATGAGVVCWGANERGQLGRGTTGETGAPGSVALTGPVTGLACGNVHACAIAGGEVVCWGQNADGQVTTGTAPQATPVASFDSVRGVTPVLVSAGFRHTCTYVTSPGFPMAAVYCRGSNDTGQACTSTTGCSTLPEPAESFVGRYETVACGDAFTCVQRSGSNQCFPSNGAVATSAPTPIGSVSSHSGGGGFACMSGEIDSTGAAEVVCWGDLTGLGRSMRRETFVNSSARAVSAGLAHACAIVGADVVCWGDNGVGQTAPGGAVEAQPPTTVAIPPT